MYVIGTAGHVDHGKSALIRALTGIDPDRLREEKERGLTIDLGFAWLKLPSGREVSIIDVPGHERFIKNMLAGVGGIDVALLVIAADEGVMPQTREHVSILELLRIWRVLVVITKCDLVDNEWLELVLGDVADYLGKTTLRESPVVRVSAVTGQGLEELVMVLDCLLEDAPPKEDLGRPRLPIDRVFTIAGFGTIVTGTLTGGQLRLGQEVEVLPQGLRSRVRGLQMHKQKVEVALPGTRVAINLAALSTDDLQRGDVVTIPGWLRPTAALDVELKLLAEARPLRHNATVGLHIGSAEATAKVALLERDQLAPGVTGWAQLRLGSPLAVVKGDLFVLRTPNDIIGGGQVVDPHPRRHRRFREEVVATLEMLRRGSPEDVVLAALGDRHPSEPAAIAGRCGLPINEVEAALESLEAANRVVRLDSHYVAAIIWNKVAERVAAELLSYHRQYPLRLGMPKEEMKSRLGMATRPFNEVLARLVAEHQIAEDDATLRLPGHRVQFSPQQQEKVAQLLALLGEHPYSPPSRSEWEQQLGLGTELIGRLVEQRRVVRVSDDILFLASAYEEMVQRVVERIQAQGHITVAEVRDMFGTSRKYALALMEHLDEQKVTRRVGDERVLR